MTQHEGVWANGGFAFFYDDPSFDCVFKLSKVSAACGSWPPRSATAPCPGVTGGLFRLVAAPSSRDQPGTNGRAAQGPLAQYARLRCGRKARPTRSRCVLHHSIQVMPPSRRANRQRRESCVDPQSAAFASAAHPGTAAQSEMSAQVGRSAQRGGESVGSDRDGSPGARSAGASATDRKPHPTFSLNLHSSAV